MARHRPHKLASQGNERTQNTIMSGRAVDPKVELLHGGLDKLRARCTISGSPKANTEGLVLPVQVVTSLFAPPPIVATHIVKDDVVLAELCPSGIPGGSTDPMDVGAVHADAAAGGGGGGEEESEAEGSEASEDDKVEDQGPGPTESTPVMASLAPTTSGPPPMPCASVAGMVAAEPASGAPLTVLLRRVRRHPEAHPVPLPVGHWKRGGARGLACPRIS